MAAHSMLCDGVLGPRRSFGVYNFIDTSGGTFSFCFPDEMPEDISSCKIQSELSMVEKNVHLWIKNLACSRH